MEEYISIDRIEGDWAIGEDTLGNSLKIARAELPAEIREGDCLRKGKGGAFYVDEELTRQLRHRTIALQKKLFKKKGL
mgnify:CR=1 FL=1